MKQKSLRIFTTGITVFLNCQKKLFVVCAVQCYTTMIERKKSLTSLNVYVRLMAGMYAAVLQCSLVYYGNTLSNRTVKYSTLASSNTYQ